LRLDSGIDETESTEPSLTVHGEFAITSNNELPNQISRCPLRN